ncbi:WRKY domain-containing protein [Artemisia annua]|uniref:WRKY domain-containing protein n=1 Tax=Artemisia annua TaxID=35608 RepID=A0A2U1Q541_ARTAN|nr:WRKY domain-containing protein [Artemisia annua]
MPELILNIEKDKNLAKRWQQQANRKIEAFAADVSGATRASEVDILSDGHRWRKYGGKDVKGDLKPRLLYCVMLCGLLFNLDGCALLNAIGNLELSGAYAESLTKLGHDLDGIARHMDPVVKKVVLVDFAVNEVDTRQWWRWLCGRYDGGGDW